MAKARILLTTAGGGNANNLIRSVHNSELDCYFVGTNISKFELMKSIADKNYIVPRFSSDEYVESVKKIMEKEKIDFMIPNHENEIRAIIHFNDREMLDRCFIPSRETVDLCLDKLRLTEVIMEKCQDMVPVSMQVRSQDDVTEFLKKQSPAWIRLKRGAGSAGATLIRTLEEGIFWVNYWMKYRNVKIDDFMISEYLPGDDHHFFSLWKDGEMLIGKSIQRLQYCCAKYTLTGTSSSPSLCKLVDNQDVYDTCETIVKSIDPHANGLFAIDLKGNKENKPYLTEINIGRFPRINYIFNLVGDNIAENYIRIGLKLPLNIGKKINYAEEYYLARDFDTIPVLKTLAELENPISSEP